MRSRVRQLIEKIVDKVRELVTVAPALVPVPVTPRPRR
jgi:hypothetical protein